MTFRYAGPCFCRCCGRRSWMFFLYSQIWVHPSLFPLFHELRVAVQQALSDLARLDGDSDQAFQAGVRLGLVEVGDASSGVSLSLVVLLPSKPAETSLLHMYDIEKSNPWSILQPICGGLFFHHIGPPTRFSKRHWRDMEGWRMNSFMSPFFCLLHFSKIRPSWLAITSIFNRKNPSTQQF